MNPLNEPIAVIGSACRFASGATSPQKLWSLLKQPHDVRTSPPPNSHFNAQGFYHPSPTYHGGRSIAVRQAYFLGQEHHPGAFDAEFFGIKPVEAKALDPQQRLLLETVYEGLEAAGLPMENLRGSDTGVYVGVMSNDYEALMLRDTESMATYHAVGTQRAILANRISYFFDWLVCLPSLRLLSLFVAVIVALSPENCENVDQLTDCRPSIKARPIHGRRHSLLVEPRRRPPGRASAEGRGSRDSSRLRV